MIPYDWKYYVLIRDTHTGEERRYYDSSEWSEGAEYNWQQGNFSCDCNRSLHWYWAIGGSEPEGECADCDGERYNVPFAVMRDGQVVVIDGVLEDE